MQIATCTLLKEMCSITHIVLSLKCKLNSHMHVVHCEDFGNGHSIQNNLHTHTENYCVQFPRVYNLLYLKFVLYLKGALARK